MPSSSCVALGAVCLLAAAAAAAAAPDYYDPRGGDEVGYFMPPDEAFREVVTPPPYVAPPRGFGLAASLFARRHAASDASDPISLERLVRHFRQLDADYHRLLTRDRSAVSETKRGGGKQCFFNPVTCFGRK